MIYYSCFRIAFCFHSICLSLHGYKENLVWQSLKSAVSMVLFFWVTCAGFHHWPWLSCLFHYVALALDGQSIKQGKTGWCREISTLSHSILISFSFFFFNSSKLSSISVKCQPSVTIDLAAHSGGWQINQDKLASVHRSVSLHPIQQRNS